jgi:hypothetical protein
MSPPAAASKNLRASFSPSARRAGGGGLPRACPPAAMRCLARAKIFRQFTSAGPGPSAGTTTGSGSQSPT